MSGCKTLKSITLGNTWRFTNPKASGLASINEWWHKEDPGNGQVETNLGVIDTAVLAGYTKEQAVSMGIDESVWQQARGAGVDYRSEGADASGHTVGFESMFNNDPGSYAGTWLAGPSIQHYYWKIEGVANLNNMYEIHHADEKFTTYCWAQHRGPNSGRYDRLEVKTEAQMIANLNVYHQNYRPLPKIDPNDSMKMLKSFITIMYFGDVEKDPLNLQKKYHLSAQEMAFNVTFAAVQYCSDSNNWGYSTNASAAFKELLSKSYSDIPAERLNDLHFYVYLSAHDGGGQQQMGCRSVQQHYYGGVSVRKQDKFGNPLNGAEFTITSEETGASRVIKSGSDGEARICEMDEKEGLKTGWYTLKETKAPAGYELSQDTFRFYVSADRVTETGYRNGNKTKEQMIFQDLGQLDIHYGYVQLHKTSSGNGQDVAGSVYTITAAEDIIADRIDGSGSVTLYHKGDVVLETMTSVGGLTPSEKLPVGKYTIEETKAAGGYLLNTKKEEVTVTENSNSGAPVVVSVKDDPKRGKYTVKAKKVITNGTKIYDGMFTFGLFRLTGKLDPATNEPAYEENPVATAVNDKDGNVTFKEMTYDPEEPHTFQGEEQYVLMEISPVKDRLHDKDFSIDEYKRYGYDLHKEYVFVQVVDDGSDDLKCNVYYSGDKDGSKDYGEFGNTFKQPPVIPDPIKTVSDGKVDSKHVLEALTDVEGKPVYDAVTERHTYNIVEYGGKFHYDVYQTIPAEDRINYFKSFSMYDEYPAGIFPQTVRVLADGTDVTGNFKFTLNVNGQKITWQINMGETVKTGEDGKKEFVPQNSGTFYDLLPEGAVFTKKSVQVMDAYDNRELSAFTVNTIDNYKGTGRAMLIVHVNETGKKYVVSFDTNHAWNAIKDYGNTVYNPVAYETGNASIYNGFPDNGGKIKSDGTTNPNPPIRDTDIDQMSSLDDDASNDTGEVKKFIYSGTDFDISAITAASSGLTKKVKSESDTKYTYDTTTTINGAYSYEIRYQNAFITDAKNLIFFDSLENYYKTGTQEATEVGKSDWKGMLQSIEVNQLTEAGAAPVVYAYTGSDDLALDSLGISKDYDFTKAVGADSKPLWHQIDADQLDDLAAWQKTNGTIKAFAIDARKAANGSAFVLGKGKSVTSHVYMKAPDNAPDAKSGNQYPYTYNNIYLNDTVIGATGSEQDFFIHQDYTKVKLVISRDLTFKKVNKTNPSETVSGITYRIAGTSDYGTQVDMRVTTNSNGMGVFEGIEKGSYLLQEYETTDDWLIDTTEHTLKVDGKGVLTVDGEDYTNTNGSSDKVYVFQDNPRIHGDLFFSKRSLPNDVERNGAAITGAKFRLSGTSDYGTNITMYATSDNGTVVFKNIEKGIYELQEVSLPDGSPFVLSDRVYQVVCDESGNVAIAGEKADGKVIPPYTGTWSSDKEGTYTEWVKGTNGGTQMVFNEDRYFSFDLRKVDAANTTTALAGAQYTISGTSDLGTVYNDTFTTDGNGLIEFALNHHPYLEKGTYILQETKAPKVDKTENGVTTHLTYALDPSRYLVMIDYHGNVSIVNYDQGNAEVTRDNNGNFVFKDDRVNSGEITITKIWDDDADNSTRPLPKITITTYDPSEPKVLLKFNPNGGTWSTDSATSAKQASFVIKTDSDGKTQYLAPYKNGADPINIAEMAYGAQQGSTPNVTRSGYQFNSWTGTDSDRNTYTYTIEHPANTKEYKIYKLDKNGNKVSIDSTDSITITAQWDEPKVYYAVSPYGIGKETLKEGTAGITFGPATGNMFSQWTNNGSSTVTNKYVPMVNAHAVNSTATTYLINDSSVSDGTATAKEDYNYIDYSGTPRTMNAWTTLIEGQTTVTPAKVKADMDAVQPEDEAAITDSSRNIIVGEDAGTDSVGNAYRCIHYDNWNTILYWNEHDPHVYDKCVKNHCSKRLEISLIDLPDGSAFSKSTDTNYNKDALFPANPLTQYGQYQGQSQWLSRYKVPSGDGDSFIGISCWNLGSDAQYTDIDEYSASLIRAELVGADSYTSKDAKSAGSSAELKASQSVYMAFPAAIRNQMGAKELYDTQNNSQHGTNVDGKSGGRYYDKLWLFDYNEIFNPSNTAGSSAYTERKAIGWDNTTGYGARGSLGWWWLRSRDGSNNARDVSNNGRGNYSYVGSAGRVAPGFVLKQ